MVIFREINSLTIFVAFIFKVFGFNIGFLESSIMFTNKKWHERLKKLKILWLNYQEYEIHDNVSFILNKSNEIHDYITELVRNTKSFDLFKKELGFSPQYDDHLLSIVKSQLDSRIRNLSELILFVRYFENNYSDPVRLFVRNDYINRIVLNKEGIANVVPSIWIQFKCLNDIVTRIVLRIISYTHIYSRILKRKFLNSYTTNETETSKNNYNNLHNYEVVYFPHKGIWYGNLYKKNQFYSGSKESPFHPSKILHISLGDDKSVLEKSYQYYKKKNIPYCDWSEVPINTKNLFNDSKIYNFNKLFTVPLNEWELMKILIPIYSSIRINIERLKALQSLKIVLLGYEILFPPELAIACKKRKINIEINVNNNVNRKMS